MELSCRVCLQLGELMVHIYEEVEDLQSNLSALLEKCGGITVSKDDDFPKYLCKDCTSELLIAAKFREKCCQSDKWLQEYKNTDFTKLTETKEEVTTPYDEVVVRQVEADVCSAGEEAHTLIDENILIVPEVSDLNVETLDVHDVVVGTYEDTQNAGGDVEYELHDSVNTHPDLSDIGYEIQNNNIFVIGLDGLAHDIPQNDVIVYAENDSSTQGKTEASNDMAKATIKSDDERYECDSCGAYYMQLKNLKCHMERSHSSLQLLICDKCRYCFTTSARYDQHIGSCDFSQEVNEEEDDTEMLPENLFAESMTDAGQKNLCPQCGKKLQSSFALNLHMRTHTGERPFPCLHCPKAFKSQYALSVHLKRHFGTPDFSCHICKKGFYETSNLNAHMRTHTGEKPHACKICGKRFSRVFLLQLHMRIHTGERPYQCKQCSRAFTQQCDLKNHEQTHSGERHHQCLVCGKKFIKRYALLKHMRKHPFCENAGEHDDHRDSEENHRIEEAEDAGINVNSLIDYPVADDNDPMNHVFGFSDFIVEEVLQEKE